MSKKINPKNFTPIVRRKVRYTYVPVQETHASGELGSYVSYGISIRAMEEEIAYVSDVSTEFEAVRRLSALCTENELAPEHLKDVVEDFLNDDSLITT